MGCLNLKRYLYSVGLRDLSRGLNRDRSLTVGLSSCLNQPQERRVRLGLQAQPKQSLSEQEKIPVNRNVVEMNRVRTPMDIDDTWIYGYR